MPLFSPPESHCPDTPHRHPQPPTSQHLCQRSKVQVPFLLESSGPLCSYHLLVPFALIVLSTAGELFCSTSALSSGLGFWKQEDTDYFSYLPCYIPPLKLSIKSTISLYGGKGMGREVCTQFRILKFDPTALINGVEKSWLCNWKNSQIGSTPHHIYQSTHSDTRAVLFKSKEI